MPKSRKRKITKKNNNKKKIRPYEVIKKEFVQVQNPFPDEMTFEEKAKMFIDIGNEATNTFETAYQDLCVYFKKYDSLYLCSFCAYYFGRHIEGIDEEAINGFLEFPPFNMEILQCLALQSERVISAEPLRDKINDLKSTIQLLCKSQPFTYYKLIEKATSKEDIGEILLRSEMMSHTLAVRNWAYIEQMESIAYDLAESVKVNFILKSGFDPKEFLAILFSVTSLTEKKLNEHLRKTANFCRAKSYNEVFNIYEESFSGTENTNSIKRNELWAHCGKNLKMLKALFLAHSDLFLDKIYTHSTSEIFNHLSEMISEEKISLIMDKISFRFGDLTDVNKDHIFLDNPIHSKPFIKINENEYFSVIPHMFSHLGIELLEKFISEDNLLKKEYNIKKGKYLEKKIESLFAESFPEAQIFPGSEWICPTTQKKFENDLLVIIEDFAIIIECKSGTVSPPAKRGATDRLFKTFKELVVAPSEQAIRFENYLKGNKNIHTFKTRSQQKNIVDSSRVKYYVPLGITLSNLGSIGCNLKKLIEAKVTSHTIEELAPSISFTDLEKIFEILTLQSEKVHYLSRRREFEAHVSFQGDEMDLFGFYLDNGFNIGETEYDSSMHIDLTLKSKEIDPYFMGVRRGRNVKKPYLKKSTYWNDLLHKIENDSNHWLMASYILLNLPKEDQFKFEMNLKKLKSMIIKGKCKQPHNWMIMTCGPERRKYAIVGYPYKDITLETRNNIINDILDSFKDDIDIRGVLILGYNLNSDNYPYSVLAGSNVTDFLDTLDIETSNIS